MGQVLSEFFGFPYQYHSSVRGGQWARWWPQFTDTASPHQSERQVYKLIITQGSSIKCGVLVLTAKGKWKVLK